MRELLDYRTLKPNKHATRPRDLSWIISRMYKAKVSGGRVLKITWDKADGYSDFSWGYVEWSVRPYMLGFGCDGTVDENVHHIARQLCAAAGLDYDALYTEAYEDTAERALSFWTPEITARVAAETVVPPLSAIAIRLMLEDMGDINNGTLSAVLTDAFVAAGYDVDEYWIHVR